MPRQELHTWETLRGDCFRECARQGESVGSAKEKMKDKIQGGIVCTRGVIVVKGQDQRNGDLAEVETVGIRTSNTN